MTENRSTVRYDLRVIAHDAMVRFGLLPEFSPAVLEETVKITSAEAGFGPDIRDLRQ